MTGADISFPFRLIARLHDSSTYEKTPLPTGEFALSEWTGWLNGYDLGLPVPYRIYNNSTLALH